MTKRKKLYKILGISAISFVALILILLIAVRLILSDKVLTNLVNRYANEYLDAWVNVGSVELILFKELPFVGVMLSNVGILLIVTIKNFVCSFKN